jgi:hypothetical protein
MRQRQWKVEWRAVPKADGIDRLGRAMRLVMERAAQAERRRESAATPAAATESRPEEPSR